MYVSTRPQYSLAGLALVVGLIPWALEVEATFNPTGPVATTIVGLLASAPAIVFLGAKWFGPESWFRWCFVPLSTLRFVDLGFEWVDYAGHHGFVAWSDLEGIHRRGPTLLVDVKGRPSMHVPQGVRFMKLPPAADEFSLAMILAQARPDEFVTSDPEFLGLLSGLRRRSPSDLRSDTQPRPYTRSADRTVVLVLLALDLANLVRGVM